MRNLARQIVVTLVVILAAAGTACSSPTAPATPPDARFDGGITFGSGNFAGTTDAPSTTAADSGSTARGGIGFGSGN